MTSLADNFRALDIAVIGAGASGLMAVIRLREEGHNVVCFEKTDDLGGTWRDNRYPGISCDVPSMAYRYSFAPNANWSKTCAPGAEILDYFKRVARDHDVYSAIRFCEEITGAAFRNNKWELSTSKGYCAEFDIVVTATGVLHHIVIPSIPGAETFAGDAFHSARWKDGIDLRGKKVGIIGTGSTGTQIVSAIFESVEQVVLFQRTAQWILPVPNPEFSEEEKERLATDTEFMTAEYDRINDETTGKFAAAVVGANPSAYRNMVKLCNEYLTTVRDPELRRKLTPDYPVGCKRMVMSDRFYEAIQQPQAHLVAEAIERIEPGGVRTDDGILHELDVLVYATGFNTHRYFRPMEIIGENGLDLKEAWADENISYMGVATPGFPNWFMIGGPLSPIGNFSWLLTAESQFAYINQLIDLIATGKASSVSPSWKATERFLDEVRAALPRTIWTQGCHSWYVNDKGNVASYPWVYSKFLSDMAAPDFDDFDIG